jgi:hypothetical protein
VAERRASRRRSHSWKRSKASTNQAERPLLVMKQAVAAAIITMVTEARGGTGNGPQMRPVQPGRKILFQPRPAYSRSGKVPESRNDSPFASGAGPKPCALSGLMLWPDVVSTRLSRQRGPGSKQRRPISPS